jgi:lysophospholipase L1-like esterase
VEHKLMTHHLTRRSLIKAALGITLGLGTVIGSHVMADDAAQAQKKIKIVLVGDSTVATKSGWGSGFIARLTSDAQGINKAVSGRSSKNFRDEGHWEKALALKPDYVLIQFGHNDMPGKGPTRETDPKTTFPENLARYVDEARAQNAKPILVTSLTRRTFDANGKIKSTLVPYVEATKKVAAEKNVPLIDLHQLSIEYVGAISRDDVTALEPKTATGARDFTHLSEKGAEVFGNIVADEVAKVVPELAPVIKPRS